MADENDGKPPGEKDTAEKESDSTKDEAAGSEGTAETKAEPKVGAPKDGPQAETTGDGDAPKAETPAGAKADAPKDEPTEKDAKGAGADRNEADAGEEKATATASDSDSDSDDDDDDDEKAKADTEDDKAALDADDDENDDDERDETADEADDSSEEKAAKAEAGGGDKKDPPKPPERKAQAWGRPLVRLDKAWTTWEVWLCAVAIVLEVLVLTLWVGLKGLSTEIDGSSKAGIVFRAITGAVILGVLCNQILKRKSEAAGRAGAIVGILLGVFLAKSWGNFAVNWSGNLLNWYQQASFLTLLGGLRGVGTRLTLLLALLGGSLATAAGKHITIDLATRYMKPKLRLPVVVVGWLASSAICATAAWGFLDHIAIDDFGAKAEMRAGEKISQVSHGMSENFFMARKQIALDFKSLPHVLKGERYSEWMSAAEWNAWIDSAGFVERYGKEQAELLKVADDVNRAPIVLIPEKGEPRGELSKAGNLVFPIGLFIISLRFILLALLALSGHKNVDPDAAHEMGFKKPDDEPEGSEAR